MRTSYWERLVAVGGGVPSGAALDDLTAELVAMLGDADSHVRDELGFSTLARWIADGVYDELLVGLGDGLAVGLRTSLGDEAGSTVLRRSYSARALAAVVARDNAVRALHPQQVFSWADHAFAWYLEERDLRAWLPAAGWADAVGNGADLLAHLAASRHLGSAELSVVLDVVGGRLLAGTAYRFTDGEDDRLASAVMSVLQRDLVGIDVLETWLERLATARTEESPGVKEFVAPVGGGQRPAHRPMAVRTNTAAFLRALHLQLLLGVGGSAERAPAAPQVRSDLLIALQAELRASIPGLLKAGPA